jgi:hypothetical protein
MSDRISLVRAEEARCEAIVLGKLRTLEALLTDDLVHVHATGYADGKQSYLAGLRERIEVASIERGPLSIRECGASAVMTGTLTNVVRLRGETAWQERSSLVTQVWRLHADAWRLMSYHACAQREARADGSP